MRYLGNLHFDTLTPKIPILLYLTKKIYIFIFSVNDFYKDADFAVKVSEALQKKELI